MGGWVGWPVRSDDQVIVERRIVRAWEVRPLGFGWYMQRLGEKGPSEKSPWVRLEAPEDTGTQPT